jgi:hypothetical protein
MRGALVLMAAQGHQAIGAELLVVSAISLAAFGRGDAKAIAKGNGLRLSRIIGGSLLHLAEMIGATLFLFGHQFGLSIAAVQSLPTPAT